MLNQPASCIGCALHGIGTGFMVPSLSQREDRYGVALVGEALGEDEANAGRPFVGRAGFKLTRLLEHAGLDRDRFDIFNVVWCRPPENRLEGQAYELPAISHCRTHWWGLLSRSRVVVPMGNVPMGALLGRKGILSARGYVYPGPVGTRTHLIPTVHPSFIQRGQSKYSAPFIHDVQKAVELARDGLPVRFVEYVVDPSPMAALAWARDYYARLANYPSLRLAYDIETPYKGEDEGDLDDEDDPTYHITRIGFSFRAGHALSVPWTPEYIPAIRLLLESFGEKVVWNAGFDNPRIRANGVAINGIIHDGMIAWHILHSDLPKGLGFVATFTCPYQSAWKHTSGSDPGRYNATDADVEWTSFDVIERELRANGLWDVYERDVLEIQPVLDHMTTMGMPVDQEVRHDRAVKLADRQRDTLSELERLTPIETRRYSPKAGFVRAPEDTTGLITIRVQSVVRRCDRCGMVNPTKPHFRTLKKPTAVRPQNPCGGAGCVERTEMVDRFARLDAYRPSREQIIRYNDYHRRPTPLRKDKKSGNRRPTTDEKAIKEMIRKYGDDPFYPLVLTYRELDKLAGTYIGRPGGSGGVPTPLGEGQLAHAAGDPQADL